MLALLRGEGNNATERRYYDVITALCFTSKTGPLLQMEVELMVVIQFLIV